MKTQLRYLHVSALVVACLVLSRLDAAGQASAKNLMTVKTNTLGPALGNLNLEVEFMPWQRFSLLAGAGTRRTTENALVDFKRRCTWDHGMGLTVGGRYYLLAGRSRTRTLNGLAGQLTLSYTRTDQIDWICEARTPESLTSTNAFAANASVCARKTFLDRVVVEAVAGLGWSRDFLKVKTLPGMPTGYACRFLPRYARSRLVVPVAVNLGVVF